MRFSVGDVIRGNHESDVRYCITNSNKIMLVMHTDGDLMNVRVIASRNGDWLKRDFDVANDDHYFYLVNLSDVDRNEFTFDSKFEECGDIPEDDSYDKNLFDTSASASVSDLCMNRIMDNAKNLLSEYDYEWTDYGIREIMNTWKNNKAWIIALLSKHPKWDNDKGMIILSEKFTRRPDSNEFYTQAQWMLEEYVNILKDTYSDPNGESIWSYGKYVSLSDEGYKLYRKLYKFIRAINHNWSDDGLVNEYMSDCLSILGFNTVVGQKISKVCNKYFTEIGLSNINKTKIITLPNGETRERKDGYNVHFAALSDALNPCDVKRKVIISINPIDYWTMSFGKNWASCHTIDKTNKRGCDNNYSGCYSAGTESYMLDSSSIIMYVLSEKYDGTEYELQDKIKRCMFHIGENKIVQGRVYPDGRDGGEEGLSAQMRNIMQKIISECLGVDNSWTLVKGTSTCDSVVDSEGQHYRDYSHYSDCNVSFLKRQTKGKKNYTRIKVGHDAICPNCGEEHYEEDNIMCPLCQEKYDYWCGRCGCGISEDDYDAITTYEGEHFCCSDCASEAGYIYCEDDGEWVYGDDAYWDDYEEIYFHNTRNMVCTSDGNYYRNSTNANNAGYYLCEDGEYYHEDTLYTDDYDGTVHSEDEAEPIIMKNGKTYSSEENAIADGWVNVNGEWEVA